MGVDSPAPRHPARRHLSAGVAAVFVTLFLLAPDSPAQQSTKYVPAAVSSIESSAIADFETYPPNIQKLIESALALTRKNLGYLYGSADPAQKGMDCSGAVYYVLRQNGIKDPPRSSAAQYEWARQAGTFHPVTGTDLSAPEFADLKPGDLLFWNGTYDAGKDLPATHAMFYLGKAKSDGLRLMVGSSDGRRYRDKRRDGVSVFDFRLPKPGSKSRFIGYARVPGLQ